MQLTAISCLLFSTWIVRIPAICTNLEASLSRNTQFPEVCPLPRIRGQLICARIANISWLERPPLIFDNELSRENLSQITRFEKKGILLEVIERAFNICCFRVGQNETRPNYAAEPKKTLADLHQEILRDKTDIILPIHSEGNFNYGGVKRFEFVEVLKSPRLAVIVNSEDLKSKESIVLQVLNDIWPIVLLAVILAAMSGIIQWTLETALGTTTFPRTFHRGAFDGLWWAFVTMSTVGYGDKVPRSSFGRVFAIIWIMIGITLCSTLTATVTSTFNKIKIDARGFELTGKRIGVIDDTQGYYEAIKEGAEVKVFHTFQEMQRALLETREVEAILEEIHPAVYSVQNSNDTRLVILKHFESERRYGFVINNKRHPYLPGCVRALVKDNQKDIFVLINRYLTQNEIKKNDVKDEVEELLDKRNVGVMAGICLAVMIACGFLFQLSSFLWKRGRERKVALQSRKENRIAVSLKHITS